METKTKMSLETQPHIPAEHAAEPTVKFVMWYHNPKYAEQAAAELAGCQVVGFELVGLENEAERQGYNDAATAFVSADSTDSQRHSAEKHLQESGSVKLMLPLFKRLQGSVKRIVTFDSNLDDPANNAVSNIHAAEGRIKKLALAAPSKKVGSATLDQADMYGDLNRQRNPQTARQVTDLLNEYAGTDTKVGILIGGTHTPVQHSVSKTHRTERVFVGPRMQGQSQREQVYYPPESRLARQRTIIPEKPVNPAVLHRAVLQKTWDAAALANKSASHDVTRVLENLPDPEVSELLATLDGIKKGVVAKVRRKRTAQKLATAIITKASEVEQRQKKA